MRKYAHTRGVCSPRKKFKIRCSEIASEAIFVLKFIFGLNAARIPGRVFLEHCSSCSGITEPSLHMFQRRGMVKKVQPPLSIHSSSLSAFMTSKAHIVAQKPHKKTAKLQKCAVAKVSFFSCFLYEPIHLTSIGFPIQQVGG